MNTPRNTKFKYTFYLFFGNYRCSMYLRNMCVIRYVCTGAKSRMFTPNLWKHPGLCLAISSHRTELIFTQTNNYVKHFSSSNKSSQDTKKSNQEVNSKSTSLTSAQKLKKAVAEYGATVIVFHVGISLISLGSFYLLVSSGLDVQQLLINLKLDSWLNGNTMLVSNAGTFAVAYAIHKVFAPARIAITLGSVPFIVRYLRHKGILKK